MEQQTKNITKKFFFNTGVHISMNSNIKGGIDSGNGIVVIPLECKDVPEHAVFLYACNNPNLETAKNVITREIHNSGLLSKYAYLRI